MLLLRGSIELSETARSIRFEELVALVADRIMSTRLLFVRWKALPSAAGPIV